MNATVASHKREDNELMAGYHFSDTEILIRSRVARLGLRLIRIAQITSLCETSITFTLACALVALSSVNATAQTPGGNIFGSDQQVGNAIREAIKWGRNLLFLMGVVFVGWGVVNYGTEKPAAKQIIAAIGCFAFGGIVALVYSISQGNAVNLDTGFGN
ncbi:MAG: hypothetical protein AB7U82_34015 [Blastocatellales bacterium]